jgi:hypothetical protein
MKKITLLFAILGMYFLGISQTIHFETPANSIGALGTTIECNKYLRQNNISTTTKSFDIVQKMGLMVKHDTGWYSPVIFPTDTFKANKDSIWVVRGGEILCSYNFKRFQAVNYRNEPKIKKPIFAEQTNAFEVKPEVSVEIRMHADAIGKDTTPNSLKEKLSQPSPLTGNRMYDSIRAKYEGILSEGALDSFMNEEEKRIMNSPEKREEKYYAYNAVKVGKYACNYKKTFSDWQLIVFKRGKVLFAHNSEAEKPLPKSGYKYRIIKKFVNAGHFLGFFSFQEKKKEMKIAQRKADRGKNHEKKTPKPEEIPKEPTSIARN